MPISLLILTLNEEINLRACLDSVAWCDDIVILDSGSTDLTVAIAAERHVRVVVRPFDTYAAQRNFGLREISYRHPWVLMLDADERVTPELAEEMRTAIVGAAPDIALWLMRRRDHLFGRWIRRSSGYPSWFGRLARVGHVWVERPINEEYHTDGRTGRLSAHLDHYPFNKGFSEWIRKHDRYSTAEAALLAAAAPDSDAPGKSSITLKDSGLKRRKRLKQLAYATPARPVAIFLWLYIVRGGLFEGRAGLTFAALRGWYEFMIDCKRRELQRRSQRLPV